MGLQWSEGLAEVTIIIAFFAKLKLHEAFYCLNHSNRPYLTIV